MIRYINLATSMRALQIPWHYKKRQHMFSPTCNKRLLQQTRKLLFEIKSLEPSPNMRGLVSAPFPMADHVGSNEYQYLSIMRLVSDMSEMFTYR